MSRRRAAVATGPGLTGVAGFLAVLATGIKSAGVAGFLLSPALAQSPRPLFDGATLKGWKVLGRGAWTVADGAITGKLSRSEPEFSHLVHDTLLADFTLSFRFLHVKGNAGCFFRMEQKDATPAGVSGMQVVLEPTLSLPDAFGLYETNGRGWVRKWDYAAHKAVYRPGEWNEVRVEARGTRIRLGLNGTEIVHLADDAAGRRQGKLALKLHGGQDVEIRFRDIHLLEAPVGTGRLQARGPGEKSRGSRSGYTLTGRRRSSFSEMEHLGIVPIPQGDFQVVGP